jgi:hypothetical protein
MNLTKKLLTNNNFILNSIFKSCKSKTPNSQNSSRSLLLSSSQTSRLTNRESSINVKLVQRLFSTTPNRSAIPPILWLLLKPVTKIGAILAGRGFRKWWTALPNIKRTLFIDHLKRNKFRYIGIVSSVSVTSTVWVYVHIQETPITKRKRFIMFNSDQLFEIEKLEKDQVCGFDFI